MTVHRTVLTAASLAAVAGLALSGCSSATKEKASETKASSSMSMTSETTSAAAAAGRTDGRGLRRLRRAGAHRPRLRRRHGRRSGNGRRLQQPVLTTLSGALSGKLDPEVDLVETLNNGEFTVFAPTDEAFGKVDAATIDKLKTDARCGLDPDLPRGSRSGRRVRGRR